MLIEEDEIINNLIENQKENINKKEKIDLLIE